MAVWQGLAPEVSIIIVTFNSEEVIGACLASIGAAGVTAEVIVVDNQSQDGTVGIVQRRYPEARLIETGRNAGYSGGNNIGMRAASAEFFLLLNPDTAIESGGLGALIGFARAHPEAGLIGCRLRYPDGQLQHSCFRFPNLTMALNGFFERIPMNAVANGRYPEASYETAHPAEHVLGAALLASRQFTEEVGLLDERTFPMYFEETDWCFRAQRAGWKVYYTPAATIVHHEAHSTSRYREKMSVAFYRSQARFYRRHYGLGRYLILKLIHIAGLGYWLARSTNSLLRGRISAGLWWQRAASYWAILGT